MISPQFKRPDPFVRNLRYALFIAVKVPQAAMKNDNQSGQAIERITVPSFQMQ